MHCRIVTPGQRPGSAHAARQSTNASTTRGRRAIAVPILVATLVLTTLTASAQVPCGDPCFEDTDDILGIQTVAPADDLVAISGLEGSTPAYQNKVWTTDGCDGTNCQVSGPTTTSIVSNACGLAWRGSSTATLDRYPIVFEVARLFDLPNDVVVTIAPSPTATGSPCSGAGNLRLTVHDPQDSSHDTETLFTQSAGFLQLAKGDATGDGFDDLILFSEDGIVAITATDPEDPSQGVIFGPVYTQTSGPLFVRPLPVTQPSTGDLNSDGLLDIAWVGASAPPGGGQDLLMLGTVCPGSVGDTKCDGAAPLEIRLGSTTVTLAKSSWTTVYTAPLPTSTAVIGHFDSGLVGDQLALFQQTNNGLSLNLYTVASGDIHLVPQLAASKGILPRLGNYLNGFHASAAPLSFDTVSRDDLVYSVSWETSTGGGGQPIEGQTDIVVVAVTFADGLQAAPIATISPVTSLSGGIFYPGTWFGGHAAGRFAGYDDSTSNLDLQIAVLSGDAQQVWQMQGTGTTRSLKLVHSAAPNVTYETPLVFNMQGAPLIRAGDIEGRSLRLGAPEIVRIDDHSQPSLILGAPPTHIDFITPSGEGSPEVINISAVEGYESSIALSATASDSASQQSTTSYSYAVKDTDTSTAKVSYPGVSSISLSANHQTAVTNAYTTTQSTTNQSFVSAQMKISNASSFDDVLWYESNAFNIYHYPVLGAYGCPEDQTCDPGEELPLYLVVSGPDTSSLTIGAPAHNVEWFQPIHEVGNLLSYPQTPELLAQRLGSRAVPLTTPTAFVIADNVQTDESVGWQTNSNSAQTSGATNTHSTDKTASYTAKVGTSLTDAPVDTTKSTSWATLNTSSTTLAASTGVGIVSPGTARGPSGTYDYTISPGIYGYTQPDGSVQELDLGVDVPSYGPLTVDFHVSPTGSWWTGNNDYTSKPDLALNHPKRWSLERGGSEVTDTCLFIGGGTGTSCASFNEPGTNETDPWMSSFLEMRGFFITTQADQGEGSLVTEATDGDVLFLQTRLYNYSLVSVSPGDKAHVRFYAQEWCTSADCGGVNIPVPGVPSFLVADVEASNPHEVDPTGAYDNWVTASTSFDTAGLGDKTYVFWVVAYLADGDGALVAELPGHGILAIPGDSIAIDEADWLLDLTEAYGNNVGLFHWPVTIESLETASAEEAPSLTVTQATATENPSDGRHAIEVRLRAESGVHRSEFMTISARGPVGGEKVIDVERTPHLESQGEGGIRIPYRAPTCGLYEISVGSRRLSSGASTALDIACDVDVEAAWLPPARKPGADCERRNGRACRGKGRSGHGQSAAARNRGLVRVALIGSEAVDASDILVGSLQAGPGAAAARRATSRRVDSDRLFDLVVAFRRDELALTEGDSQLCVTGSTKLGQRFAACLPR